CSACGHDRAAPCPRPRRRHRRTASATPAPSNATPQGVRRSSCWPRRRLPSASPWPLGPLDEEASPNPRPPPTRAVPREATSAVLRERAPWHSLPRTRDQIKDTTLGNLAT